MKRTILTPFMVILTFPILAAGQNFAGQYALEDPQGRTTMVVQQAGGKVTGTITMDNGATVGLQGEIKGNEAIGIAALADKNLLFKLHFQGAQLIFTMVPVTADNKPDMANAQQFPFSREGGGGAGPGAVPSAIPPGGTTGQGYTGTFTSPPGGGSMSFVLEEDAQGRVTGTLTTENGNTLTIETVIVVATNSAIGTLRAPNGNTTMIKLQPTAGGMGLAIAGKDGSLENAQLLVYPRAGGAPSGGGMAPAPSSGNPLAGGASGAGDPFAGTFSDGNMQLQLTGSGGRYQGQIQFQGQSFPASAQSPDGRNLTGKFTSGADSFDFTGSLQGSTLAFVTGGRTYQLRKQGGASAAPNPLGGGGAARSNPGASGAASAQPIAGGQSVNDPEMGVRFSVPAGWKHQKQQGLYIIGHDTIPGSIIITPHTFNSAQEVIASANEPLYQGQDGQLMVSGQAVPLASNILAADYGGHMQGKQARGRIVAVLSPHGGGLLVMAGADAASYGPQYAQMAEGIARSMQFSKPVMSAEAQNWSQRLRGRKLHYLKSNRDSGVTGSHFESSERSIYLCSDGSFQGSSSSQMAFDTAGGFGHSGGQPQTGSGRWEVATLGGGASLVLRLTNGETLTYKLETDGSKTYLNGERWFLVENPVCP